ncbi:hypothetical protein ABN028_06700 [Actinopolymorpha sp. B17G11]|uniref:hypothetical protein n=1 Tax=Actinopolymorpha sp. B17G11 TaxID=3160861 RepID=UPI0032E52210
MKVAVGKDEPDELAVPAGPFRGAPRRAGGWWKADAMLVTSRSAAEYAAMFDLASEELAHATILGCCAGGSSFVAETGTFVVAADPAYAQDRHVLVADATAGRLDGDRIIEAHADRFEWGWYGDRAHREPVAFLPVLREQLHAGGHRTELRRVPYQFQRGADQMLVISVTGTADDARTEAGR